MFQRVAAAMRCLPCTVMKTYGLHQGSFGARAFGGAVDGALEFNGATFVAAGYVLSPSDGPFSVLAWVKGGAPG